MPLFEHAGGVKAKSGYEMQLNIDDWRRSDGARLQHLLTFFGRELGNLLCFKPLLDTVGIADSGELAP